MLTATDILSALAPRSDEKALQLPLRKGADMPSVAAGTPLPEILPVLLDSPDKQVSVRDDEGVPVGAIDSCALLAALTCLFSSSRDCSWIEISVPAADYSASAIARAVEDADASLLDLLVSEDPADPAHLRVLLRVDHIDPSGPVRSLERYRFNVVSAFGARLSPDSRVASERISNLKLYLNI